MKVALEVEKLTAAGRAPTFKEELSTEDEYQFQNDGRTFIIVKNGSAEPIEVTVVTPGEAGGLAIEDRVVEVPAESDLHIGPFDRTVYSDAERMTTIKFSAVASVSVATLEV